MVQIDYSSAQYYDGGTGLSRDTVFAMVFETGSALENEELTALSEVTDVPETVRVTEVRVEEESPSCVNVFVRIPELTVGTQPGRGRHSQLVFRGEEYSTYQVAIEN